MTSLQVPVGSPFRAASTVDDVLSAIDLTGKTVIVTGGYSGLGREAVRALVRSGATVIVPARNIDKAKDALAYVGPVDLEIMDLMNPASIDAFAENFLTEHGALDILINCAGVMAAPLSRDSRGNESQFSTNVLGHFQLICRLWPALIAAKGARVVNLSSANHRIDIEEMLRDPNFEQTAYDPWKAYANSKAANILMALAFDDMGKDQGIRVFSAHPGGIIDTGLARHMDIEIARQFGMIDENDNPIIDPEKGWKTPPQGAATMVWAATSPLLVDLGGVYCADCEIAEKVASKPGEPVQHGVLPDAVNPVSAGRLWQICSEMTGALPDFPFPTKSV